MLVIVTLKFHGSQITHKNLHNLNPLKNLHIQYLIYEYYVPTYLWTYCVESATMQAISMYITVRKNTKHNAAVVNIFLKISTYIATYGNA